MYLNSHMPCQSVMPRRKPIPARSNSRSAILRPKSTTLILESTYANVEPTTPRSWSTTPRPQLTMLRPKSVKSRFETPSPRCKSTTPRIDLTIPRPDSTTPRQYTTTLHSKGCRELLCTCSTSTARARIRGNVIPGMVIPREDRFFTSWNGQEASSRDYEILINKWNVQGLQWLSCSGGQMPSRAVQGGHTRAGEPLYIARALTPEMTQCIGTFRPSTGLCYIPWRGKEVTSSKYEILCHRSKLQNKTYIYAPSRPLGDTLKVQTLRNPFKLTNFTAYM